MMKENTFVFLIAFIVAFPCHLKAQDTALMQKGGQIMKLTSPAFEDSKYMPAKYTCDGSGINPPLAIDGIPGGTKSLVLISDDPDAPMGTWVHWVVWDIPVASRIEENSVPGKLGANDSNKDGRYGAPCPPSGTHRYFFKVYALDVGSLGLAQGSDKQALEQAIEGHVLGKAELIGLYKRGAASYLRK